MTDLLADIADGYITGINNSGAFSWDVQEKAKGDKISVNLGFTQANEGSTYMGWGFNLMDPENSSDPVWYRVVDDRYPMTPANITTAYGNLSTVLGNSTVLGPATRSPLFLTGWGRYEAMNPGSRIVDTSSTYIFGPQWPDGTSIIAYFATPMAAPLPLTIATNSSPRLFQPSACRGRKSGGQVCPQWSWESG